MRDLLFSIKFWSCMRNILASILCCLLFGFASVSNSEFEMVSINGLSSVGENFFISSHSRTEIAGSNVIEGQGKMFCQGQETITMLP